MSEFVAGMLATVAVEAVAFTVWVIKMAREEAKKNESTKEND